MGPGAIVIDTCIPVLTGSLYITPSFIRTTKYSTPLTFSSASRLASYVLLAALIAAAASYIYTTYPTYKYAAFSKHSTAAAGYGFEPYYLTILT